MEALGDVGHAVVPDVRVVAVELVGGVVALDVGHHGDAGLVEGTDAVEHLGVGVRAEDV